ncbi:MAG: tetratricopeptide repeat protein [Proteobacteria bacterium]|nr:tetratricopeptide repeat protein [Pseudomonadota bacterium]
MPEAMASDPASLERFQREAKLLATMDHGNIGAIYGFEQERAIRYLVLEYVEGGDLALTHLADAFYNRANARSYKGALEFAIADYGSAIVNKPEFPSAYYNRGFALEATGQHTRALADSMRARALGLRRLGVRSPDVPPPRP